MIFPLYPDAIREQKSGAGAVNVTSYTTELTAGGAVAITLAAGTKVGQMKRVVLDDAAGVATITPVLFVDGATVALAGAIGNYAELMWTGEYTGWRLVGGLNATVA